MSTVDQSPNRRQRLLDLLADRATGDLDDRTSAELDRLLAEHGSELGSEQIETQAELEQNDSFENTSAEIELAFVEAVSAAHERDDMPERLKERLRNLATEQVGSSSAREPEERLAPVVPIGSTTRRSLPWLVAAAAMILTLVAWWPKGPSSGLAPQPLTTASAERKALQESVADTVTLAWQATDDPSASGADGDVVWSASRQAGFMRIRGLEVNDPKVTQYQLWVFDKTRDERHPVDGGVFDVPTGSDEVVIPIDVRVPVGEAYLFAVTVEPPGGVVVSERERIVLVAQPV